MTSRTRVSAAEDRLVEIACDESGYEGEKLVGGSTEAFAHAGVALGHDRAAECMRELRRRIRSPATEYKANHLQRQKHRGVLVWLLGPSGPLLGNARVCLVDKVDYLLSKVVAALLESAPAAPAAGLSRDGRTRATSLTLLAERRRTNRPQQWEDFLTAANNLMRMKDRMDTSTSVAAFFDATEELRREVTGPAAEIVERLGGARSRAEAFRLQLLRRPGIVPVLDPLLPAIMQAIGGWSAGRRPVAVVHDRQNTLSPSRVAWLTETCANLWGADSPGRLVGFELAESFTNPPIQLADILAGTARSIASAELNGHGDAELTELLRPYVDPASIWGDTRSWSRLKPYHASDPIPAPTAVVEAVAGQSVFPPASESVSESSEGAPLEPGPAR